MYRPRPLGGGAHPRRATVIHAALASLAIASPSAAPALAQEPPTSPATTPALDPSTHHLLPATVVEGSRLPDDRMQSNAQAKSEIEETPGGVEIVTEKQIRETRTSNLQDALEFVPGVLVRPRFGSDEAQISIRGSGLRNNFHLRGVNLLIDGFPYGNGDGFGDFESLELLAMKRIEVFKGPTALRFGANSIGGAINFTTLTGYDAPGLTLRSEFGSFGYFKNFASAGMVHGGLDLFASYSNTLLDGYRKHSNQERNRAYSTAGYDLGDGLSVRLDFNYIDSHEKLPGPLTFDQFEDDPRQANPSYVAQDAGRNYDYERGAVTLRKSIDEYQAVEWLTQGNGQDLDHPLPFAIIDQHTANWGSEVRYLSALPLYGHQNRFTIGFQYFGTYQRDRQFQNQGGVYGPIQKDDTNLAGLVGLYADEHFDVDEKWTAVLGGRVQWSYRDVTKHLEDATGPAGYVDYFALSPKFGVLYQATPEVQLFANASHANEPPLLLELTAPANEFPSVDDLKSQDAWQFEIGTRGELWERLRWDLSLYDIELWDEIRNVNIVPFPGAPFTIPGYTNIDRSRHWGVELGLDAVLAQDIARTADAAFGDRLKLINAYTFGDFRYVDDPLFGSNQIPGLPSNFLAGELKWETDFGLWLAPGYEAVPNAWYVNSENTVEAPAYALFNFRSGYVHAPWNLELFFEARNLLDLDYVSAVQVDSAAQTYFEPGDGRAFYGGVQWRWF